MNRRRLLTGLSAAAVCLRSSGFRSGPRTRGAPDAHRLVAVLGRPSAAAAIGRAYLAAHASEADAGYLAHQIMQRLRGEDDDVTRANESRLRRTISLQIRQDFATNRVVSVGGWILSQTEARLCGLAALLAA